MRSGVLDVLYAIFSTPYGSNCPILPTYNKGTVPLRSSETEPHESPVSGVTIESIFTQQAGQVFVAVERIVIAKALELSRHNQVQAARLLGVSRNVLRDRMKRYGLS